MILTDFDGVLVDSTGSVDRTWAWWTARHGIALADLDGLRHGVPSAQVVARVAPHLDARAEAEAIDGRQAEDPEGVVALPGAAELLAREDVAIVTSCTPALLESRLKAAGLLAPPVVVTSDRVRRGKPDPEPYLLGAAELGAEPRDCVVLEDAPAGVAAGRAAGAHVVGILTTHRPEELPGADAFADSVADWLARVAF